MRLSHVFAGALLMLCAGTVPPQAKSNGPLKCMEYSYAGSLQTEIFDLAVQADISGDNSQTAKELEDLIVQAVSFCADKNGWDGSSFAFAMFYEFGRLGEYGLRNSGRLPQRQLDLLDAELARVPNTEMWAVMDALIRQQFDGASRALTDSENLVLDMFVLASGVDQSEEIAMMVGELLSLMSMQRIARDDFEAQFTQ